MKRQLNFDYKNGQYVITEKDTVLFSIDGKELKFVSLDFYNGIYKDKSAAIELKNIISDDELKKGKYIFEWLTDIITSIQTELNDLEIEDHSVVQFVAAQSKQVYLFEMAACAGDGFYSDGVCRSDEKIVSQFAEADFAVRISGRSMEPTIKDGEIVFVQNAVEINDQEIGIFVVNGDVMCKRLREENGIRWLQPDNATEKYKSIMLTEEVSCYCQGRVLLAEVLE